MPRMILILGIAQYLPVFGNVVDIFIGSDTQYQYYIDILIPTYNVRDYFNSHVVGRLMLYMCEFVEK